MKNNDWKERLGVMYSTNPDFLYQTEQDNEQDTPPKEKQTLRISLEKHKRAGKTVTLITGFQGKTADLVQLGKLLRTKCGAGGTAKDGDIILQGDMRTRTLGILLKEGYTKSRLS